MLYKLSNELHDAYTELEQLISENEVHLSYQTTLIKEIYETFSMNRGNNMTLKVRTLRSVKSSAQRNRLTTISKTD